MKDAKKKLSSEDKDAKMSVLKDIMKNMDSMMCDDIDSKKKMKVSVMSDSKKGLAAGLDQAEDIMEGETNLGSKFGSAQEPGALMNEEDYMEDSSMEPEMDDEESMTSADIDAKIKKLMALKEQKSVKAPF
jgi:hypothetical protein